MAVHTRARTHTEGGRETYTLFVEVRCKLTTFKKNFMVQDPHLLLSKGSCMMTLVVLGLGRSFEILAMMSARYFREVAFLFLVLWI